MCKVAVAVMARGSKRREFKHIRAYCKAAKTVERMQSMRGDVFMTKGYQWRKREQNKRLSRSK
jgi:hypothetical protein